MDAKVEAGKPLTTQPNITLAELKRDFATEEACKELLRDMRWPDGVKCPRCNSATVYALKTRPFHWVCKNKDCGGRNGYRFSVITKTVFENTNYPLTTWFEVIYLMGQSKKGISALQIHRQIRSGDYRTAWYMCHRIRAAMKDEGFPKLMGEVEIDETYMGGKETNKHLSKRGKMGHQGKTEVIGAIARKGNIVCKMVEDADFHTYDDFVRQTVSGDVTLVSSDESHNYRHLTKMGYPHDTVAHGKKEYVRGKVQKLKALTAFGRCLSVASWGHIIKSVATICRSIWRSSNFALTTARIPIFSRQSWQDAEIATLAAASAK